MRLRACNSLVLLSMLLGIAACGEKPVPTKTMIATTQATPSTAATTPEAEHPTAAPTETAPDPTATAVVPTTRPGAYS